MTPPAPCSSEVLLRNVTSCFGKDLAVDTLLAVAKWDSEDPPPGEGDGADRAPPERPTGWRRPGRAHSPVVCDQALPQAQLPEDVHHDLHGRVVRDREWAHVKDAAELQGPGTLRWEGRGVLCEAYTGTAHYPFLFFSGTL